MKAAAAVVLILISVNLAQAQEATTQPIDAPELVRQAKQSQDWMALVKSFHVKFEIETVSYPRPGAATQPTTAPRKQSMETAFDQTRLYTASDSPFGSSLRFWDGKISGYAGRENAYEITDSMEATARSMMTNGTWGRNGQIYWWMRNRDRPDDFIGSPAGYRLTGVEKFHDVDCYVLEGGTVGGRCFVGKVDHRLYGSGRISSVDFYTDYKEVAPNCWYPMTQGMENRPMIDRQSGSIDAREAATRPTFLAGITTRRVTQIDIDQPLPDELFATRFKEGMRVHESIGGVVRDYVYRANSSEEEQAEIRADAERRKLFAPPQLVPGEPVRLSMPLDPLPLNPLATNPAADFPGGAKWLNGQPVKLADLRGKVVLVMFWANWQDFTEGIWGRPTPPDMKLLDPIRQDVVVVGVHVPTTNPSKVESAIRKYEFPFAVCIDLAVSDPGKGWGAMAEQYRVDELPAVYVIDTDGKVAAWGGWSVACMRARELLGKATTQP